MLNYGTTLLFFAVTTATALVTTPWLVDWLGEKPLGAFRVIFAWYGYLTLLELGLGGAIAPMVARNLEQAREDPGPLERTLSAGVRAYAKVSLATVLVGLLVAPWITYTVRDLQPELAWDLRAGWLVLLLGFLPLALLPFRSLQDAEQRGYRNNLLQIVQSLTITAISLWLASRQWGILGQSIALTVGAWIFPVSLAYDVLRRRPGLLSAVLRARPDADTRRSLRELSGATLIFNITSRISLMTDDIVVGKILGDGAVTRLFLTQRLAVLAQSQIQAVGSATWAALAQLHVQGHRDAFNRRLVELTRLVSLLAMATLGPIVAFNPAFLRLWMRHRFEAFPGMEAIILTAAASAWMMGLVSLWGWCISGTGHMGLLRRPAILSAVINLGLSLALCYLLGLVGVLLGTMFALLSINMWYLPMLLRKTFGVSTRELLYASVSPALICVPVGLVSWWVAHSQAPVGWLALAAEMGLGLATSLILSVFLLLSSEDRQRWKARLIGLRGAETPSTVAP